MEIENFKIRAIEALVDGATQWSFEDDVVTYADKSKAPTDAQIVAKSKELKDAWDAAQYQRDRAVEYPSIADQLDDLYHNGIDGWKKTIKVVKDKHPKA
jgi:hypothetical protein